MWAVAWKLTPTWLKLALAAALIAVAAYYAGSFTGARSARLQAATEALQTSVRVLRERNQINDQVSTSDAAALCSTYGLSDDDQAECVRRLSEADPKP